MDFLEKSELLGQNSEKIEGNLRIRRRDYGLGCGARDEHLVLG
jgi:hypothetical protein